MLGRFSASDLGCCGCKIWSQKFDFSSEMAKSSFEPKNCQIWAFCSKFVQNIGQICPILVRFYPIGSKNRPKCQKKSPKWTKVAKSKALHLTEKCPFWRRFFHFFHPKWDVWNWRQKMAKFRKICKKFQKKANFRRQFFGLFFHGIHSQAGRMDESAIFFKKFAPKIGQMADFRAMWYCSTKERQCLLALWKVTPIFRVETRPRNNSAKAGYKCTF